jgi:hypothetical protein
MTHVGRRGTPLLVEPDPLRLPSIDPTTCPHDGGAYFGGSSTTIWKHCAGCSAVVEGPLPRCPGRNRRTGLQCRLPWSACRTHRGR